MVKTKFTEGERVLCYHGILLYEAKCLEHRVSDKVIEFKVHYAGWNKSWDEWVPEDRILKYNEASLQKQKELKKEYELSKVPKKKGVKRKSEAPKAEASTTSSSRASTPSSEASSVKTPVTASGKTPLAPPTPKETSEPEAKIMVLEPVQVKEDIVEKPATEQKDEILLQELIIPENLKKVLVDDWYLIQKQDKLYNLPAKETVRDVLDNFIQFRVAKTNCDKSGESALREVAKGICTYFDVLLGKQLLYKFERPQYAEILQKHPFTAMSQIYGAPHLLRLFSWKGSLVSKSQFDENSCEYLNKHFKTIIKYLADNKNTLFNTDNYMTSTPEYHRRVI
ncbi:Hypothetical predicted protein [Cloeon dipterum]|uniref:Chromo domain-containing protein n=1 Tax=Cloeon dipterum TaxID=197152 RepID=A0A8S1C7X4_9INSE|nr:Hypothetical predicted protein [Cloeon dipterum]